jgi:hypothetical protein
MTIRHRTHRLVPLDLLSTVAAVLKTIDTAPETLRQVQQVINADGVDIPKHYITIDRRTLENIIHVNTDASRDDARAIVAIALKTRDAELYRGTEKGGDLWN